MALIYMLRCSGIVVLLLEEYLHYRREYRIRINVVLVVQLLEGAGLTKMDHPEGVSKGP
jgi:hypothetical protein